MISKIIRPKQDGNATFSNTGSCAALVNYLSKEDKDRGDEMEYFFDHHRDNVLSIEVVNTIDSYRKGLGRNDTKFYSIVIAPTSEEIDKMKNPVDELKELTREYMDIYAKGFTGKSKPKNLEGKDLVYFAKLEYNRYYKGTDEEVKNGLALQGEKKPGVNMHVHIVVSRKDRSDMYKISPCVKNKKLFHIEGWKLKAGYRFEIKYNFEGAVKELEKMMKERDGNDDSIKLYSAYKPIFPKKNKVDKEIINETSSLKTKEDIQNSPKQNIKPDIQKKDISPKANEQEQKKRKFRF